MQGLARRSLGKPRFKQSTGLFEIHPLPSARSVRVFRRLRSSAKKLRILEGSALDPPAFFTRKRLGEKTCLVFGKPLKVVQTHKY